MFYAIEDAGSDDPEDIYEALVNADWPMENFCCPWPRVKFGPNGQNEYAAAIMIQVQYNEEAEQNLYATVWPWDVASEDLVYPAIPYEDR
jgi:branched-chain amino acid transport system substrate-binding protein